MQYIELFLCQTLGVGVCVSLYKACEHDQMRPVLSKVSKQLIKLRILISSWW